MARLYTDVELRSPASLTPYPHNGKRHPQSQIDRLAGQIAAHGFDQPIVVDRRGVIVKGHGRRQAALQLGLADVPVVVSDLSEEEARAARIADNQLVSLDYDTRHLEMELRRLRESEIDLALTGMDDAQIGQLLRGETDRQQDAAQRAASSRTEAADAGPPLGPDSGPPPRSQADTVGLVPPPSADDRGGLGEERFTFVALGRRKVPATGEEIEALLESLRDYESDNGTSFGFWTSLVR